MNSKEKFKRIGLPIIMGAIALVLAAVCVILFLNDPYKPKDPDVPGVSQEDPQQTTPSGGENVDPSGNTVATDNQEDTTDPTGNSGTQPTKPTEPIQGDVDDDVFGDDNSGNSGNDTPTENPGDNSGSDTPTGNPGGDSGSDTPSENPGDNSGSEGGLQPDNGGDNFQGGVPF